MSNPEIPSTPLDPGSGGAPVESPTPPAPSPAGRPTNGAPDGNESLAAEAIVPAEAPAPASSPIVAEEAGAAQLPWYATIPWETVAWVALIIGAAVLRFWHLGQRGMSHDESLHTMYGYYLYNEGRYEHNPMMHGPFRFHMTALSYFLFGANDYTSRIVPALLGTVLVGLLYPFRRWLGRTGAFTAALLIAVSPSLLFHSRYIRDDIFIATFTTLWALSAFRYFETRRFAWLMGMVLAMAFSFVTMENSFITGAVFGGGFILLALWSVLNWRTFITIAPAIPLGAISYYYHAIDRDDIAVWYIVAGLVVTLALALFFLFTTKGSWERLRRSIHVDTAVVMLTLVMPFLGSFLHVILHGDAKVFSDGAYTSGDLAQRMVLLVGVMTLASAAVATLWFQVVRKQDGPPAEGEAPGGRIGLLQWGQLMLVFWAIQILFFTTFFTNTGRGLATGIVGSLGYWLAQQNVERGNQPWYYYMMIGGLYEFVPIILTAGGMIALLRGFLRPYAGFPVESTDLPALPESSFVTDAGPLQPEARQVVAERALNTRNSFLAFAVIWVLGMWAGYTVAGEKMPWLLTHMALPMCILGGWWVGRMIHAIPWRSLRGTGALWLLPLLPALILVTIIFVRGLPPGGENAARTVDATAAWMRALLSGLVLAGLLALLVILYRRSRPWAGALLGLGVLGMLFVLNVRASFMLTFVNYDMATEYLVYAHASPDVKEAMAEIESISQRTVGGRNIAVAYDNESSWPFSWYFRDFPNARYYGDTPDSNAMAAPIILVAPENRDKVVPYVERDYVQRTHIRIWWPDMDYYNLSWERIRNAFTDPQQRERLWQIVMFRRHRDTNDFSRFRDLTQWPARHEFDMWVRKDLANQIWDLNVTPLAATVTADPLANVQELDLTASLMDTGPFSGAPLVVPRAVDIGPAGRRVIADTGNHRIVVVKAEGAEYKVFGSFCDVARPDDSGCVDPDGDGPLERGDGQFNEPWGVAVDGEGTIYVADTWNGRIQVFSSEGQFLRKWGYFNTTGGELGDAQALFGPRGLAIDLEGNLIVADTGNKRIIRFTPEGELVDQIGGGGVIAGRFDEPTDVAVDPTDGSILVADSWNRRIQRFDPSLAFLSEFDVPGWVSREIFHKPAITVDAAGLIYATDPQYFRLFVFDREGEPLATQGRYGSEANRFALPTGIAADLENDRIAVTDADNNRVMVFPTLK